MLRLIRSAILFAFFIARAATNAQSRRSNAPTLHAQPTYIAAVVS
ncbi:MAG TPA: hypothetical protein VER58_11665 [Thermoanaerobaculia bacterium]|nr:hypothetical protein [Thermoanaerobaculia bacterium]